MFDCVSVCLLICRSHPSVAGASFMDPRVTRRLDAPRESGSCRVIVARPHGVTVHDLTPGDDVIVGRASPADIVVDDDALSRRHVRLAVIAGQLVVEDLGSTNGTRVDSAAGTTALVSGIPVTLASGARLWLGSTQLVVVTDVDDRGVVDVSAGLLPHGAFLVELRREVERARLFQRPLTLVHVRSDLDIAVLWGALARHRRSVDRAGVWARHHYELLWPETGPTDAARRVQGLIERLGSSAIVVTAGLPGDATSADGLEAAVVAARHHPAAHSASRSSPGPTDHTDDIVAASAPMLEVMATVKRLVRSRIPVLLQGETGVGKEVIARALHGGPATATRPFVAVNCGALPATLVESMLFGHEKGAFTGAVARQPGHFEQAHGGTLFLDEIAELPLAAQAALLRVLESRQVRRLGGARDIDIDVRVVAASHRDLPTAVAEGRFREDLLFRLNSFVLDIPPLRERRADIVPLAQRFLAVTSSPLGRPLRFGEEALAALAAGRFVGNVRELRNIIERAAVLCDDDVIEVHHLPETFTASAFGDGRRGEPASSPASPSPTPAPSLPTPPASVSLEDAPSLPLAERLDHLERQILERALREAAFDTAVAAEALGLPRRTLQHRLKLLGVRPDRG
jgi:two-component system, NtrC family, response regulator AtoC